MSECNGKSKKSPITRRQLFKFSLATGGFYSINQAFSAATEAFYPPVRFDQPSVPIKLSFASFRSPDMERYVDALPIPPRRAPGGTVTINAGNHQFHRDVPAVPSWGFDGMSHSGPTMEVRRGISAPMTFKNTLGKHVMARDIDISLHGAEIIDEVAPKTVVHLHGAPNRPEYDGHPHATFRPSKQADYDFNHDLEATTLWYHDHAMGLTRLNVYAGLVAQYWIRDKYDTGLPNNLLGLPSGDYEIPLTICDKIFYDEQPKWWWNRKRKAESRHAHLRYQGSWTVPSHSWGGGLVGDRMVVNGKVWPYHDVDRGVYRFRIVNGSQLSDYRLEFSNKMPYWVIGSDGGLLDKPAYVKAVDVAPGERYDILVDFSNQAPGTKIDLLNTMRISWAGQLIGAELEPGVMQFRVGTGVGPVQKIPETLRGGANQPKLLPPLEETENVRTVSMGVTLTGDRELVSVLSILTTLQNNLRWVDPGYDKPQQGTTEYWDLVNADVLSQLHAMHIHLIQYRVVGRFDLDLKEFLLANPPPKIGERWAPDPKPFITSELQAPAPYEMGWKDTVRCPPRQVTRIQVKWPTTAELGFDPDAIFKTPEGREERGYVWHCHVLDHEDNEMMHRLRIVDPLAKNNEWQPKYYCDSAEQILLTPEQNARNKILGI